MSEGYAYRVDLRLRPYGKSGNLVPSDKTLHKYYRTDADLWEIQALLKMTPVAGNLTLGQTFLDSVRPILRQKKPRADIAESIAKMRALAVKTSSPAQGGTINLKTGWGGIRDIEFLLQGLQLIHAHRHPEVLCPNTLDALERLTRHRLLPETAANQLRQDYIFLRRVEHYVQIWEDQQIHCLPRSPAELDRLARLLLGSKASSNGLLEMIKNCQDRVRNNCQLYLYDLYTVLEKTDSATDLNRPEIGR